jgi:hypothetical protein
VILKLKTGNICIKSWVSNFALLFNCFIPFDFGKLFDVSQGQRHNPHVNCTLISSNLKP